MPVIAIKMIDQVKFLMDVFESAVAFLLRRKDRRESL
jgi:hypothetical protein